MKIKHFTLLLFCLFISLISFAQELQIGSNSYVSLHTGTFININNQIEGTRTIKILERYNTPGFLAGISYDYEKKHLTLSAGLNAKIIPFGFQTTIKKTDLEPSDFAFDFFIKRSQYIYILPSLPLKIGYQTLPNKANQKFWINTGLEINFSMAKSENYSYAYTPTGANQSTTILSFISSTEKRTYLGYNIGFGIAQIQKDGHQLKFGLNLNANLSAIDYIHGDYTVKLKNQTINGSYHSTGSNVGLSINYCFNLKEK